MYAKDLPNIEFKFIKRYYSFPRFKIYSDEEILDKMMEPDFYKSRQGEYDHRQGRKKLCAWPSNGEPCKNISNRNCPQGFCNRHNMIYKNRVKAGWDKKDLFAPVALRKGKS